MMLTHVMEENRSLKRLSIDPSSVVGDFDVHLYGRVESRAAASASVQSAKGQETLIAEAAKLLKNVGLEILAEYEAKDKVGWKGVGCVVSVDGSEKGLASPVVFQQLLRWAEIGVFGGIILGSWFSEIGDSEDEMVLKLRAILLHSVAQAFGDSGALEFDEANRDEVSPEAFEDPHQLALWALQRSAARLSASTDRVSKREPVFFVCERSGNAAEKNGWDSETWKGFQQAYGFEEVLFDQACLGGSEVGSTTLLTSSWFLYETLHANRTSDEIRLFLKGLSDLRKLWGHESPGGWTLGLRRAIRGAWLRWKEELGKSEEVTQRRALLAKLTEEEAYAKHVEQDHVPYRKGCPICISAQGRQRSHWRSSFPDLHALSVDMAGPFVSGQAFNVEASGRDRGGGYRYMLAFAYAIPNRFKSDVATELEEYEPSECGQLTPEIGDLTKDAFPPTAQGEPGELFPELFSLPLDGLEGDGSLRAVTHRVRSKRPEGGEEEGEAVSGGVSLEFPKVSSHRESPAGNRAELAIQNLKGFVRKRTRTGFDAQWEPRTVQGIYVGHEEDASDSILEESEFDLLDSGKAEGSVWDIGFPQPLLEDAHREAWVVWHDRIARLSRMLLGDLCNATEGSDEVSGIAENLRKTELLGQWLEQGLEQWVEPGDMYGILKSLHSEIPLNPGSEAPDQFLQTRTISLAEARKELGLWKDPAIDEVTSLETTSQAVDRVKVSLVEQWIEQGFKVIQLPGKAVLTRKSGTGKRRFRAVCCGNYLPPEKLGLSRDDIYASGAEAVTLRVSLSFVSMFPNWTGITIDIKTAFLYAPIGTRSKDQKERIIVKPPSVLIELGVLKPEDRWYVKKALYGLPTSPRDWGDYRDGELRKFVVTCESRSYGLIQSKSDESLWFLRLIGENGLGDICGILVVYVDDLAFFSTKLLCQAFIDQVQGRWKTSDPSWFGEDPVTFCGAEVTQTEKGFRLTQVAYLKELFQRYEIEGTAAVPLTKWTEPIEEGVPDADLVRQAQGVTGALLWVSTRSRPDIAYAVSRMGQQATKVPSLTISIGRQVLQYLRSTLTFGIEYLHDSGPYFSAHGQLSMPRQSTVLEVYSDASHSPCGGRSIQCCLIVWRGSPLAWESTRQSFTTLSSAEAELVGMLHALQLAECLQPLLDELLSADSTIALLADNAAAVRAFETAPNGWRSRHLRMRAQAARERIESNQLQVTHLSGELQVADVGTKPLPRCLGDRVEEWKALRVASAFLRQALLAAVAALLGTGPHAIAVQGPQWPMIVEHYICQGEFIGQNTGSETLAEASEFTGPVFPQVYWGPPYTVHYLWVLFAQYGCSLLSFLGDQVRDWRALKFVASNFRASITYGLIGWLERTGRQYRSRYLNDPASSWDAAQAYLRTGVRAQSFENASEDTDRDDDSGLDDHPHRAPVVREVRVRQVLVASDETSDESSEPTETSTTEPSVASVTDSSECRDVGQVPMPHPLRESELGLPVLRYQAAEEALIVYYGDDSFEVPLQGWSVEAVQTIVDGIESGDWSDWQEAVDNLPRPNPEEAFPSERLQLIKYGRLWGRWARFWVTVAVILGVLLWGVQGARAEDFAGMCELVLPESLESQALQAPEIRLLVTEEGCSGTLLECLFLSCLLIGAWEIMKWIASRVFKRGTYEQGAQTSELMFVPLPLPPGVRCRARILYSLWRAGYSVQVDGYPEGVRTQFEGLVGDWLVRNNEGIESSPESSD
ncbi:RE1 [Symbiodinium sp. CCMP2592]|nr:RE1 [Symbiodinium sp. CCMP2592]